jgi:lactate dehydrogenase-like 2-hydroxyacid dehydrogenase
VEERRLREQVHAAFGRSATIDVQGRDPWRGRVWRLRLVGSAVGTLCRLADGVIGKRISDMGRALGMKVLIAARKTNATASLAGALPAPSADEGRVPFDDVLRQATVLALALPRNPETLNLISSAELEKMHQYALLINIARGGIVDEAAVVQALKDKRIAGYATDVYDVEPVGGPEDTPLLSEDAKDLNIVMTPHLAWFSQRTLKNLGDILKATVEGWAKGEEINVIV